MGEGAATYFVAMFLRASPSLWGKGPKKPVLFVFYSRREEKGICRPGVSVIAKAQSPEPLNFNRSTTISPEEPVEVSMLGVKGRNVAVAEVSY